MHDCKDNVKSRSCFDAKLKTTLFQKMKNRPLSPLQTTFQSLNNAPPKGDGHCALTPDCAVPV